MPVPHYLMNSCSDITPAWLGRRGLDAVAVDLDNTLALYGDAYPPPPAVAWIKSLIEASISVGIVSNNHNLARVRAHADALGVPYVCPARKPRPDGLLKMAAMLGAKPSRTAMVGDQVFTDTAAALGAGMVPVYVKPLSKSFLILIRRAAEWPFLLAAKRRDVE